MTAFKSGLFLTAVASLLAGAAAAQVLPKPGDWPSVGNDAGGMKYSTLTQLTPQNVAGLKVAWEYDTKDVPGGFRGWEMTPIVIDNLMYVSTAAKTVLALNAETGAKVWETKLDDLGAKAAGAKYGVTYWPGDKKNKPQLVIATNDGLMLQLDPKTGALNKKFGKDGLVNLAAGVMEKFGGNYTPGATPAIYKNIAIISPTTGEQGRYGVPGDPRGFDLVTGKELWRFHTVPQPGEEFFGDWGLNGWQDRRGPGAWVPLTVDEETGTVFIALGNATDQNYGGNRPGANTYATSVLALDATTGKRKWHYAITKHDIFDWDVNAPPTLITAVNKDGKKVKAVAQSTKVGYMFVLDRETGEPIWGAEDRPVPLSDAPGEKASLVQPYPLKPPAISRVEMTRDEVSRISPQAVSSCQTQYDKAVNLGPNTPYLMVPALVFPSSEGGGGWGGASFDPTSEMIYVNTRNLGTIAQLRPQKSSNILDSYAKQKIPFLDPDGYPCSATPWGELMAIDAKTGDFAWKAPLGEYKELTAKGVPVTGTANAGGIAVTAGGLLFIGATADKTFRAFDAKTGKQLWETQLTNNSINTPMTYQGKNGKQYVAAIVSSGLSEFNHPRPALGTNKIVVFALP